MSAKVATVPRVAWTPPAPRRVRALRDRLRLVYGRPVAPPHGKGLEELILTVLSQSTNDRNRDVAYLRLRARFPAWEEVRDAPLEEVEAAIQPGGLHRQKSVRIQEILRALPDPPDLSFLGELPVAEARAYLTALPGVGRKTAACVLLFAFGLPGRAGRHPRLPRRDALGPVPPRRAVRGAARRDAAADAGRRRGRAPHQPAAARPPHVPRAAAGVRECALLRMCPYGRSHLR